ncbi:uncharacterized protein LOC123673553 isoform X2 [Harmonia axyridis]|uniref:uncharacterized protein LOC123673553 isoform X2 n=1 Tax=Harmonia axyridis TaxID=115357 RepID=UPI001E277C02|nr:uncharacterized protein LOC123673553 isoform X2 [Harmonia axyridis]
MEGQKYSSEVMSNSNFIKLPNDSKDEDIKSDEPIVIKTLYTEEIYHGNKLKSRIELSRNLEFPNSLDKLPIRPLLQPVKMNESDNYSDFEKQESENEWKVRYRRVPYKRREDNFEPFKSKDTYKIINPAQNQVEKQSRIHKCISIFAVILILFLIGTYIIPYIHYSSGPIPVDRVEKALLKKILQQNPSITTIVENLNKLNNRPPQKILTCLVGPTGVGKSHLINILRKEISPQIKIFHDSDFPDLSSRESVITKDLLQKLYFSNLFVVVIDDLKIDNMERLKKFIEILFSVENNILLLTVFNLETKGCLKDSSKSNANLNVIRKNLEHFTENFHIAHFNSLNEETVKHWLVKEIAPQNFPSEINDILVDDLLKRQDIKCHGLKGLHSKLLLELSRYGEIIKKILLNKT